MTSNQFFVKSLPDAPTQFFLRGEEHHHLSRVVRIKTGDLIWLTDGGGRRFQAKVIKIEKDRTWLQPLGVINEALKIRIFLGFGLTKPASLELIIQKATELGVTEIQPLITARSQNLAAASLETKKERWQKIAREALKQSKGGVLPIINSPISLKKAVSQEEVGLKLFLEEGSTMYFRDILVKAAPEKVSLLVGPEGGWTEEEKEMLRTAQYLGLNLGGRILRAETAAISALSLISHFWNW